MKSALVTAAALCLCAGAAHAEQRVYSYDPADAATRALVDSGLTFVFDKGLMGMRVKELFSTQARASAFLQPAADRDLGERLDQIVPRGSIARDLYRIEDREQGPGMVRAFCPGSAKGWLAFSPLRPRRDLIVHVLGDDAATGKAKLCTTLRFTYRGEWKAPPPSLAPARPL